MYDQTLCDFFSGGLDFTEWGAVDALDETGYSIRLGRTSHTVDRGSLRVAKLGQLCPFWSASRFLGGWQETSNPGLSAIARFLFAWGLVQVVFAIAFRA